ncbi:MAG TPA: RagB/SusD family nutrient uptake outer membrane protein [Lutibacter sp.]|nr:RagB/SusD family nutrient uptake outer membrane protein [Lutibacter sp.]
MKNLENNKLDKWYHKDIFLKFIILVACLLMAVLSLYSCDDFVEVDIPNSQLTAKGVFEEKATANAAMTDIYSKIRDGGLLTGTSVGLSHVLGNYADELDYYGSSQNVITEFYKNSLIATNSNIKTLWNLSYNQIYAADAVMEGVESSVNLSAGDRAQLKGEALFARALIHFYLANIFGDIPYIATTDFEQNRLAAKVPVSTLYVNIKADLEEAVQLVSENYLSADRTRPNKFTVHALLARVNLYAGLWNEASDEATVVLNNTALYVSGQDLNKIFLKESKSTIWQLSPKSGTGNALESGTFNFIVGPPPISALTNDLMSAFTAGDQRKAHWTKAVSKDGVTWHHPYKYKTANTTSSFEYSIIFRLSEMYLIRAEARAHSGDLSGAKEDLNVIRSVAGLENIVALTQDEILGAILRERRLELFTEFGHRFFDLKRFNMIQPVLSALKPGWDAHDILFPIPEAELNLNPNLQPQNQGY